MRIPVPLIVAAACLALPGSAVAAPAPYDTPGPTGLPGLRPADPSTPPFVTGSAQVGGTLTGSRGVWEDDPTPTSEWLRCNPGPRTCETTGDTDTSYSVTAADVGLILILRVVATNPAGTRTRDAVSNTVAAAPAAPTAPRNVTAPSITGDARQGRTLGVNLGQWTGTDPINYATAWSSCLGNSCRQVATGGTYKVAVGDVGRRIVLAVSARNGAGVTTGFATTGTVVGPLTGLKRLSPFPTLLVDGRVAGAVTSISTLRLRRVPGGATINVSCTGSGCPFRKSRVAVPKGKSRTVALRRLQRRMRAGTVVVITVRKGDTAGKYIRLRFRRGSAPARVDRCVAPKSSKPVTCP